MFSLMSASSLSPSVSSPLYQLLDDEDEVAREGQVMKANLTQN